LGTLIAFKKRGSRRGNQGDPPQRKPKQTETGQNLHTGVGKRTKGGRRIGNYTGGALKGGAPDHRQKYRRKKKQTIGKTSIGEGRETSKKQKTLEKTGVR